MTAARQTARRLRTLADRIERGDQAASFILLDEEDGFIEITGRIQNQIWLDLSMRVHGAVREIGGTLEWHHEFDNDEEEKVN